MSRSWTFAAAALVLVGCPTAGIPLSAVDISTATPTVFQTTPAAPTATPDLIQIDDCQFLKRFDRGSETRVVDLRPVQLPYGGAFGALSAKDRWMKMFHAALIAMKEDCGGPPVRFIFGAEQLDYAKHDTPRDPAFIQAGYRCRL